MTFKAALQAYVDNVGALPGGPRPQRHHPHLRFLDGPVRWLAGYAGRLTGPQRRILQAAITGSGIARVAHPTFGTARWQAAIDEALVRVGGHLGISPSSVKTTLRFSPMPSKDDPEAEAEQAPTNDGGGETGVTATCNFVIYPKAAALDPDSDTGHEILAHEAFHCLASVISGLDLYYYGEPAWLEEGGATWAGLVVAEEWRHAPFDGWWTEYLTTPRRPLSERTYDGVGFFAHMVDVGMDPWTELPGMLRKPAKAYSDVVDASFLDSWGSSFLRRDSFGPPWTTHGPGITGAAYHPPLLDFSGDAEATVSVPAMAATAVHPDLEGDVFELSVDSGDSAHGRLRAGGADQLVPLSTQTYCTRAKGCSCPDGTGSDLPPLPRGPAWVAVTGPAQITLRSMSLHVFCKTLPPPPSGLPAYCPRAPAASRYSQQLLAIFRDLGFWSQALNHKYKNTSRRIKASARWLLCTASRLQQTTPPDPTVANQVANAEGALDHAADVAATGNRKAFDPALQQANQAFSQAVAAAEGYEYMNG